MSSAKGIRRYAGMVLLAVIIGLMTGWAVLAIYYSLLPGRHLRLFLASAFGLATPLAFILLPGRGRTLFWFLAVFAGIVTCWMLVPASNNRNWQPNVATLPRAIIQGDQVTIHNIRNLTYRTETDYDLRYYDKTFDLNKIDSVDLFASYWMGDAIAHIIVSFGFEGDDYVAFSIETRKEQGEDYSTIRGFFKQYELIYIAGDERDLVRLRTSYRQPPEDLYLYRLNIGREAARKLFVEYIGQINRMKERPEWYNTLTENCTVNIVRHVISCGGRIRYNWKILLSGYAPQYVYELGFLDERLAFTDLKKRSYVNDKARAVGNDPDFSLKIRAGLSDPRR